MGDDVLSVNVKAFTNKKTQKVMFIEANQDFVEVVCSFMTLPLGTIARHFNNLNNNINLGCLTSIYQSVVNLDVAHFTHHTCRYGLINPINASYDLCNYLVFNLNATDNITKTIGKATDHAGPVFLKNKGSFIITDDLTITPVMFDTYIEFLTTLGVKDMSDLVEETVSYGFEAFYQLFQRSLYTDYPLTNVVFGRETSTTTSDLSKPKIVKFVIQKSRKKVLCAQVDNFFVELLFSFLTIPLGAVVRLTNDTSSAIRNLSNTISKLGDENYFKSEDIKKRLVEPMVASNYLNVTDYLPIYKQDTVKGSFLKDKASLVVSDDLQILVSPSVNTFKEFTYGIPLDDIEIIPVSIGEQEALLILKLSLHSKSVLNDFFKSSKLCYEQVEGGAK